MELKVRFALVAVGIACLLRVAAQAVNHTPGTVVGWGWQTIPYFTPGVHYTNLASCSGYSLAIKQDGTVVAWGRNNYGQTDVPSGLSGVVAVAGGDGHSLALKQNGKVVSWGQAYNGSYYVPSVVPNSVSNVVAIATTGGTDLALKQDGTVIAWKPDGFPAQLPTGLSNVTAIAAGLALKKNGTLIAWGDNTYGQTNIPIGLTGVVAIASSGATSLALKSNGTVVAWGYNAFGQTNVPNGLTGVIAIAVGVSHSLALKGNGTIVAWGSNNAGQTNIPAGLTEVVAITTAGSDSLALTQDGTIVGWGANNTYGQVTGPDGFTGIASIAAGGDYSLGLKQNGVITGWGWDISGRTDLPTGLTNVVAIATAGNHSLALKSDATIEGWGWNDYGQATSPAGLTGVAAIAAGGGHYSLALKSNGTVVAWGYNAYGQTNVPTGLSGVVAVTAGIYHSLALKQDGTVVAWGAGQTNNPANGRDYGQCIFPSSLSNVVGVAAGGYHSLALKQDGTVVAWGYNAYGQTNVPNGLTSVVAIAAGSYCSLALKQDGTAVAWGDNGSGQTNVPSGLTGVVAIAAGLERCVALVVLTNQSPYIVNQPSNSLAQVGTTFSLTATAAGSTPLSYQWRKDGNPLAGKTNTILSFANIQLTNAGNYFVIITNAYGAATSAVASLIVYLPSTPPFIVAQPTSQFSPVGSNVTFNATAAGPPPLSYQWRLNANSLSGKTNMALNLTSAQLTNAGGYSVIVTNAYGSVTSAIAQLMFIVQTNRTPTTTELGNGTIPTDNHLKVFTNGGFQSGVALNTNRMTVVLTHGWNSDPTVWATNMAQQILNNVVVPPPNIVAWDWSAKADTLLPQTAAGFTAGEGRALGISLLYSLGSSYSNRVHFMGHSLGTLVNAAAANYLHDNGLQWTNTHMTLFDEAELAPESVNAVLSVLVSLALKQPIAVRAFYDNPLPKKAAWVDNYISAVGLPHKEAANVILTNGIDFDAPDFSSLESAATAFHAYPCRWYNDSILSPASSFMGYRWSFERSNLAGGQPDTNSMYVQAFSSSSLDLGSTSFDDGVAKLRDRLGKYAKSLGYTVVETVKDDAVAVYGDVTGTISSATATVDPYSLTAGPPANFSIFNLFTSGGGNPPAPNGSNTPDQTPSGANNPAYAWMTLVVPSNAFAMSFNFMLQGNGNQDSFEAALNGTNVLSLETILIQTNVTMNSGLISVTSYAGQQVELFLGIVGGTSTNANITMSSIRFYNVAAPTLQIQIFGTNVVVTWPISAAGYILQTTATLGTTNFWTDVTDVPVIVNLQYTVTNSLFSDSRFYRLSQVSSTVAAPMLQAQTSGNTVVVSWPFAATGYTLETTTNLTATNSWTAVTNTAVVVNQQNTITNQISGGSRFYRLRK